MAHGSYHEIRLPADFVTVHTPTACVHGYSATDETSVDEDGRTACCGAFSSIFADDGSEYCKCCFGSVTAGEITERIVVDIRPGRS